MTEKGDGEQAAETEQAQQQQQQQLQEGAVERRPRARAWQGREQVEEDGKDQRVDELRTSAGEARTGGACGREHGTMTRRRGEGQTRMKRSNRRRRSISNVRREEKAQERSGRGEGDGRGPDSQMSKRRRIRLSAGEPFFALATGCAGRWPPSELSGSGGRHESPTSPDTAQVTTLGRLA